MHLVESALENAPFEKDFGLPLAMDFVRLQPFGGILFADPVRQRRAIMGGFAAL